MSKSRLFIAMTCIILTALLIILIIINKFVIISIKNESISKEKWIEDIKYLQLNLPQKHTNLFFNESEEQFNSAIKKLQNNVYNLNSDQIQIELMKIIAAFGDSHTNISNFKSNKLLPLKLYWFKDGIYIIGCDSEYKNLLGYKVNKINNYSILDYINKVASFIPHENKNLIKYKFSDYIEDFKILKYFNCVKNNQVSITLTDGDGKELTKDITIKKTSEIKYVFLRDTLKCKPLYLQNCEDTLWSTYIENRNLLYCKFNMCRVVSHKQLNNIEKIANENKVKTIVVDMRNNSGGTYYDNNAIFTTIEELKSKKLIENIDVIIGRQTFSSGMLYAIEFKNKLNAKLYGEPTGGCPNSYGEINNMVLPNSKLCIQYSTKYFKSNINENTLNPDYKVELMMKDYINGVDPVIQEITTNNK